MKQDKLVDAIGMIKDEFVVEAHSAKKKNFSWLWPRRVALALACVLLFVLLAPRIFTLGHSKASSGDHMINEGMVYDGAASYNSYSADEDRKNETDPMQQETNSQLTNNKKLILTANLDLETMNLDETVSELLSAVNINGAYIQSSSAYSTGSRRYYTATIRIPADKYSDFIGAIKGSGNAVSYNEQIDDVTDTYTDLEARITALKAEEERVLDFYKQAETLEELLLVEQRLSDIRYEIEHRQAKIKNYDLLVSYSTLNISISETKEYTPIQKSFGSRFVESFKNGLTNFICFLEDIAIELAYNVWGILLLVVIAFGGYKLFKYIRNRKRNKAIK